MKFYVAALLMTLSLSLSWAGHIHDEGQPGCKTQKELEVANYRNNWDPTRYWVCEQLGVPARSARCPDGEAWLDSRKQCVEWHDWVWEVPVAPESRP